YLEFARPDRLVEGARLQRLGPRHGLAGVVDIDRNGADAGTVRDKVRMRETVRLAIDHEIDMALRPALDILAAMRAGLAKAELAEQGGELFGLLFADGEFDEADA